MPHHPATEPALSIALALAGGMLAQVLARHLRIPGLVLLLGAGVLLGPDVLGVVHPETLGSGLQTLVGFAVAVILFEGGLSLDLRHLRRQARSIRQLVTVGALVTALGGTLAARLILGWPWRVAALFGTLVIVTGPTVIGPLLRRIRVTHRVATVLEAEGVFGDAIGALFAIVALDVVITPISGSSLALGLGQVALRLGTGAAFGLAGGLLLVGLLRPRRLLPEGLENMTTLALVLALFQASNAFQPESGIAAVIAAGLVVGNSKSRVHRELREFKEQLTTLLIGMLFVLLAADVRIAEVRALGWPGLAVVATLMFVVRPVNAAVGTWRSDLTGRERLFIAWLAPRGIVAAAVASLFAVTLDSAGVPGGHELRALVFLTITVTVLVQGLTGGLVAGFLGLHRKPAGFVILGGNALGLTLGGLLRDAGHEVTILDSNPDACREAEQRGFRTVHGSALDERVLSRLELSDRLGAIALTTNDAVNLLFARIARREHRVKAIWIALKHPKTDPRAEMTDRFGFRLLFGGPDRLEIWAARLASESARIERWRYRGGGTEVLDLAKSRLLPIAALRAKGIVLFDDRFQLQVKDELILALPTGGREELTAALARSGFEPVAAPPAADA